MKITLADIEAARGKLVGAVLRTPMLPAPKLSALTGADVFVKYENSSGHELVQGPGRVRQTRFAR